MELKGDTSCRKSFSTTILELAKKDSNIILEASDSIASVTLEEFVKKLPDQLINVGISEQNAIGIGAGLASCNKKVFVCGQACFYSSRSLEQVKLDIGYNNSNVKIVGASAGVSFGFLGSTHFSLNDIAILRTIPNFSIIQPSDAYQTKKLTQLLVNYVGPVYFRIGRVKIPDIYSDKNKNFTIGKGEILMDGKDITIIASGETAKFALDAGLELKDKQISARIIDLHTIKPLDKNLILSSAKKTGKIITIEEHNISGGLGSTIAEFLVENYPVPIRMLGFPDEYLITGSPKDLFNYYGINKEGILKSVFELLDKY